MNASSLHAWNAIVASSLDWEEAHLNFDNAVANLPPDLRGRRPKGLPNSPWELIEHIRITQFDLLDFCRNPNYSWDMKQEDYWPSSPEPPSDEAWEESLSAIRRDRDELKRFTTETGRDLTAKIPHGTGQTYLRTVLVAMDHTAYHTGALVAVRRLLGNWPPE